MADIGNKHCFLWKNIHVSSKKHAYPTKTGWQKVSSVFFLDVDSGLLLVHLPHIPRRSWGWVTGWWRECHLAGMVHGSVREVMGFSGCWGSCCKDDSVQWMMWKMGWFQNSKCIYSFQCLFFDSRMSFGIFWRIWPQFDKSDWNFENGLKYCCTL